jgi:aminoglycoside phosphotransferase (APT) family kinase protein
MASITSEKGSALAEVRARSALRGAGLDPTVPLIRASSVTNEVWLTPTHAIRVNRTHDNRLAREAQIAAALPSAVGYPRVVALGGGSAGEDWLISERVPGEPLAHCWPDLTARERRRAVRQLAARLAALHSTAPPASLGRLDRAPQLLEAGAVDPTRPLIDALHEAALLPNVSALVLHEAIDVVRRTASVLQPFDGTTLIHGDLTFENVLWHDGEVTALLDVEWARPGPRDLDLDIILRCCAFPQLHVAEAYEARTHRADYADVPWWLADDYPDLFDFPALLDRLRIYAIAYEARALLASPPSVSPGRLPKVHAYHRLAQVVRRQSYLDTLRQGWA